MYISLAFSNTKRNHYYHIVLTENMAIVSWERLKGGHGLDHFGSIRGSILLKGFRPKYR